MLLNARQYRVNRGFKLYTSNRINDTKSHLIPSEIKVISTYDKTENPAIETTNKTAITTLDKHFEGDECCEKFNGDSKQDKIGMLNGDCEEKGGNDAEMDGLMKVDEDGWVKEDGWMKEDGYRMESTNDDSDFRKWFLSSELGKEKSPKKEGKKGETNQLENSINKHFENRNSTSEMAKDFDHDKNRGDGNSLEGGEVNHQPNPEISVNSVVVSGTPKLWGIVNGVESSHLKLENQNSKTAENLMKTGDLLKETKDEKFEYYFDAKDDLNDFDCHQIIPEDEFKIVNYKKKQKPIVNGTGVDHASTNGRPQKEPRDQRSFRRHHNRPRFNRNHRNNGFRGESTIVSNKLLSPSALKNNDLEMHTSGSDLETKKRSDSDAQSSLSSASSTTSDNSPTPTTSSPSPRPLSPNHSLSTNNAPNNNAHFPNHSNNNISCHNANNNNDSESVTENHKISTDSTNSLSYKKIINGLNDEKNKKSRNQDSQNKDQSDISNKHLTKACPPRVIKETNEKTNAESCRKTTETNVLKEKTQLISKNSTQSDQATLKMVNQHLSYKTRLSEEKDEKPQNSNSTEKCLNDHSAPSKPPSETTSKTPSNDQHQAKPLKSDKDAASVASGCCGRSVTFGPGCKELDTFHWSKEQGGKKSSKTRKLPPPKLSS